MAHQIAELEREVERLKAERASSLDRDFLGQLVRMAWVEWAEQHPNPKPHWLTPWQSLPEEMREVDRQIGEKVAHRCVTPELLRVEQRAEQAEQRISELEREVAEAKATTVKPWDHEWQADLRTAVTEGPFPDGMVTVKRDQLFRLLREHDALNRSDPAQAVSLWMFCEHGRYHHRCCVDCFRRAEIDANALGVSEARKAALERLEQIADDHHGSVVVDRSIFGPQPCWLLRDPRTWGVIAKGESLAAAIREEGEDVAT
jgi:hypothetical protein